MHFNFQSTQSKEVHRKLQQQEDINIDDLNNIRNECSKNEYEIQKQAMEIEYNFVNEKSEKPIFEFELDNIEKFLSRMKNESWFVVDTDEVSKKVMKFMDQSCDLSESQLRAIKIMNHLYCQHLPISVEDLQAILRVVKVSWGTLRNFDDALHLFRFRIGYLEHYKSTPDFKDNIIEFIDRCDPITTIYDLMVKDLDVNLYLNSLLWIVHYHIHLLNGFRNDLEKDGKYLGQQFQEQMYRKILKALDILAEDKFNNYSISKLDWEGFQSLSHFYEIPMISISMENLYEKLQPIEFELTQMQMEIAEKFYNSALLEYMTKIFQIQNHLFRSRNINESKFKVYEALQIILMMLGKLTLKEFETHAIPFLKFKLEKGQIFMSHNFLLETTVILSFIHLHSGETAIHFSFVDIFCKTKVFDMIINLVESTAKDVCYRKFLWNREIEERNLFWLTVTAFELIKNCRIVTHVNCDIHKTLCNSIRVIESIEKEEWPKKVLQNLMNEMSEKEKSNNRPHLTIYDHRNYHADYY